MSYNFIESDRDQSFLLPENMRDWLPEGDLALFVLDTVAEMDLSAFYVRYRQDGWGAAAYEPGMMVALVVYAYCSDERSSRRIERLCCRDVGFRVITGNRIPDHSTIARFLRDHKEALEELFGKVLALCESAGMIKTGLIAVDGTKIKANAALDANRTHTSLKSEYEEIARRMLDEGRRVDEEEDRLFGPDNRGDELPEELRDAAKRRRWIAEHLAEMERAADQVEAEQEKKLKEREARKAAGQKRLGRKPKDPAKVRSEFLARAKVNTTDPESRIMKGPKGYVQGYNAQVAVTEDQVIVAEYLSTHEADWHLLHPMVELAAGNLKEAGAQGAIGAVVADAGYGCDENLKEAEDSKRDFYIATKKDRLLAQELKESPVASDDIPEEVTARERMERKLKTEKGRATYAKRGMTVEPVFGQLKDCRRFERFLHRGREACRTELSLMCTTNNLKKLWRYRLALAQTG